MNDLIVRRVLGREEISRVHVENPSTRSVERIMSGMLINMSPEFFIDDSEFDYLYKESTP